MRVTRDGQTEDIPDRWLQGRQRAGRDLRQAIDDWFEQVELENRDEMIQDRKARILGGGYPF